MLSSVRMAIGDNIALTVAFLLIVVGNQRTICADTFPVRSYASPVEGVSIASTYYAII